MVFGLPQSPPYFGLDLCKNGHADQPAEGYMTTLDDKTGLDGCERFEDPRWSFPNIVFHGKSGTFCEHIFLGLCSFLYEAMYDSSDYFASSRCYFTKRENSVELLAC